ncbi:MAG: glycosyltransferase family 2 protein [Stomatobaculum sp.]|nr:glycosyltransferase family 2 protein [Stomatobaculum sp.]
MGNYIRLFAKGDSEQEIQKDAVLVSICAVCYNHAPYLRQALNGFLSQKLTYADPETKEERHFEIEILIHDDASTDGSADIIREYQERFPETVKPILQSENQYSQGIINISGAFNFPRAKGKYITLMDCDDYWQSKEKLSLQVGWMEAHPECQLCVHAAEVRNDNGDLVDKNLMRPFRHDKDLTAEELIDKAGSFPFGSMMLRREVVETLPEYYVNCPVGDRPLELMAAERFFRLKKTEHDVVDEAGNVISTASSNNDTAAAHYIDRPLSVYRFNGAGSWTSSMKDDDPEAYREKQDTYARQMREMYEGFDRATDGAFHKECVSASNRLYFLTRVNLRDFKMIFLPRFRRFYKELPARDKMFIRFEQNLPGVYKKAQEKWHGGK